MGNPSVFFPSEEHKERIVECEHAKSQILNEYEAEWKLKSRSLLLQAGDQNTKFFQQMASHRKNINSIWELKKADGQTMKGFTELFEAPVEHFKEIYSEPDHHDMMGMLQVIENFPRMLNHNLNEYILQAISLEELSFALKYFQRDKSPRPDGWPSEFFLEFFDVTGEDLLNMVEEDRVSGINIPASLNSNFLDLIPKKDKPESFGYFRHISSCNIDYNIMEKITALRLNPLIARYVSNEQFGFLKARSIYDAVGSSQEGLHTIKTGNLKVAALKLDMYNVYDKASWLFFRLILLHIGFNLKLTNWIMCCVTSLHFTVLINDSGSLYFKSSRGLRQGCPLSPYLFLLIMEGLIRIIYEDKALSNIKGVSFNGRVNLTHLMFVDDIFLFCLYSALECQNLKFNLDMFCKETGMEIGAGKSAVYILVS